MASIRVRLIPLLTSVYVPTLAAAGSNAAMVEVFRGMLDVEDLTFCKVEESGIETHLFVTSDSFKPVLCCWKENVPRWIEAAEVLQGIAGADSLRTSEPGPGTAGPAPQGGTE